jgi:hypothetical protein
MAERTIGLRLQINGVPETITNIKQLESTIGKLEEELKGVDIGSAKFNQLTNEIRTARGRLEDFNKSTEGLGFEKLVESVGKFAGGVTGAFAAATAAVNLFGKDTEGVSEAAAKAQNVLALAIGATTIAEGVLAAKKLFTTQATVAQGAATLATTGAVVAETSATIALTGAEVAATSATVGLTGAIKLLGNAIKSNPILFIVGTLTAAAAAMAVFGDDTEDTEKEIADLDRTLRKSLDTLDDLSRRKQNQFKIDSANAEAEGKSIEDLAAIRQKSYTEEVNLQAEKVRAINTAYLKEKQIIEKGLSEKEKQEEEHKEKIKKLDDKYGSQRQAAIVARNNAEVNAEIDKINTLKEIRDRDEQLRDKARNIQTSLIKNDLTRQLKELQDKLADDLQAEDNNEQTKLLLRQKYNADRKKLLEDAEKENLALAKKIRDELRAVEIGADNLALEQLRESNVEQLKLFIQNSERINEATKAKTKEKIAQFKQGENIVNNIAGQLTEEQYKTVLELIKKYGLLEQQLIRKINVDAFNELQTNKGKELDIIQNRYFKENQFTEENQQKLKDLQDEYIKLQQGNYNRDFNEYKKNELAKLRYAAEAQATLLGLSKNKIAEGGDNFPIPISEFDDYVNKQIQGYNRLYETIRKNGEAEIELNTKKENQQKQLDYLIQQSTNIRLDSEKQYYDTVALEQENFVLNDKMTKKQLEDNDKELKRKLRDEELKFQREQLLLQKKLIQDKIKLLEKDPTMNAEALKQLYAELSKINVDYNNNVRQETQNTVTDNQEATDELIANLQKGIDIFSSTISQIASLAAQSFSLQLEKLEADYQKTLGQVVGDTEQANQKRTELETMYQAQKKEIEKKARLTSLKIQIAQAAADAASTVLKTFAEYGFTPVGIALSAIAAVMAGVQVGIIAQQIGVVQSMARGGFLRGPSHEQGGIRYQGGGVEVEGNESVINRRSTLAYAPLLSQINMQGGGRPIYVNSVMDSRMAEVLAATKQEPIRAYVLEKDITKSQAVNRRLEQLASY